jgi:hypothetical protein
LYKSAGGRRGRRSSGGPSRTSATANERQLRRAQKTQQARDLKATFDAIENLHRQDITPAAIRQWHEQQALRGLNVTQRVARASARRQAAEAAERDITAAATQGLQELDLPGCKPYWGVKRPSVAIELLDAL